jgi:hypothetical protein
LHGKLIEVWLEQPRACKWQAGVLIALLPIFLGTDVAEISLASVLNGLTTSRLMVAILVYGKSAQFRQKRLKMMTSMASSLGYIIIEDDEEMRWPELTAWLASKLEAIADLQMNDKDSLKGE